MGVVVQYVYGQEYCDEWKGYVGEYESCCICGCDYGVI